LDTWTPHWTPLDLVGLHIGLMDLDADTNANANTNPNASANVVLWAVRDHVLTRLDLTWCSDLMWAQGT